MQCEEDWLVMHVLHAHHGWSIAKIAKEFGVDWRTAHRYATSEAVPRYRPRERPAELTEAQLAHLERRLGRCRDLRATTLYRELQELGYLGSYPSLARRVRAIRPRDEDVDPVVRFETDPGIQAQVDWTDCGHWLVGNVLRKLHAFVAVLGFCRMVAVRFATDTTRPTTLRQSKDLAESVGHNRRKELLAAVGKRILQASPITALSVWSPDGTMVFSTAPGSVGDRLSGERDRLRRVMRGGVESVVEGSVFRTYVPLRVEPGSEAQGVVQLDRPYAPMLTAATRPWRLVTNGLALGLLIAGTLFSLTFRRRTPALATDGEGELEAPPEGGVAPEGAPAAAAPRRTRGNPGPPPAYTLPGYREQVQAREAAERREEPRSQ